MLLVFFTINSAIAQTNVSGAYFSNQIWTQSGSPYRVVGNVQIPIGYTLTINPGVVVEYTGSFEILVKGTIIANGTPVDSIKFICSNGISTGVTMVRLVDVNLGSCGFSYSSFSNGEKAIVVQGTSNNTLLSRSIYIKNSSLINEAANSILLLKKINILNTDIKNLYSANNSSITIDSSTIKLCDFDSRTLNLNLFGIYVKNSNVSYSTFKCGGSAMYDSRIELSNLICSNCTFSTIYGKCIINDCKILNSAFNNTNTTQQCQVFFDINRCIIVNTSFESSVTNPSNQWWSTINIDQSIIKKNNTTLMGYQIGNLTNSTIIGPGSGTGITILSGNFSNVAIVNNNIGIVREVDDQPFSVINSNIFQNTTFNFKNNSSLNINASYNYWGVTDLNSIRNLIWDYYDDINLGEVIVSPFRITPNTNCPVTPPANFIATPVSGGFNLSWDTNRENDIKGYKLYYGHFDGFNFQYNIDLGNITSYFFPNYLSDTIAITAYDSLAYKNVDIVAGHESWYSSFKTGLLTSINQVNNNILNCIVYPNPADQYINIENNDIQNPIEQIDIFNLKGDLLYSNQKVDVNINRININNFPSGMYLLKVILKNNTNFIKLLKY